MLIPIIEIKKQKPKNEVLRPSLAAIVLKRSLTAMLPEPSLNWLFYFKKNEIIELIQTTLRRYIISQVRGFTIKNIIEMKSNYQDIVNIIEVISYAFNLYIISIHRALSKSKSLYFYSPNLAKLKMALISTRTTCVPFHAYYLTPCVIPKGL